MVYQFLICRIYVIRATIGGLYQSLLFGELIMISVNAPLCLLARVNKLLLTATQYTYNKVGVV